MGSLVTKLKFVFVVGALLLVSPPAHADSTASAIASLNWNAATFSGTISPASIPNPYSSLAETGALRVDPFSFNGSTVTSQGWTPTTNLLVNGAASTVFAQSASSITSQTTAVTSDGFFQLNGQAERSGDLTTSTGLIEITVPYTLSMFLTPDGNGVGRSATAQVWILLFDAQGQALEGSAYQTIQLPLSSAGNADSSGLLTLKLQQSAGTYFFDLGAASSVNVVPEPGTLGLVLVGLVLLIVFRKV